MTAPTVFLAAGGVMTLADAVAPLGLDTFLEEYLGRKFVLMRGAPGRFSQLVTLRDLSTILSRLRLPDRERISLIKNGQTIDHDLYTYVIAAGIRFLRGADVSKQIAEGATLVVNQVEELFPEVRTLVESCEELVNIRPNANLYAGWRTDKGFNAHWDKHDTLILQVVGRKNWTVWEPTRAFPLRGDDNKLVPRPTAPPAWDGTLEDGDALYMPRGWWHVAFPRDEPSVHVTIGIKHPTGIDLLRWIAEQMRDCDVVRMDVPSWREPRQRAAWVRSLVAEFSTRFSDNLVDKYVEDSVRAASPLPVVSLPECAWSPSRLHDLTPLRLTKSRKLVFHAPNRTNLLSFSSSGGEWKCDAALASALALLSHTNPCTLAEMDRTVTEDKRPLIRPLISALIMAEVIWPEPA